MSFCLVAPEIFVIFFIILVRRQESSWKSSLLLLFDPWVLREDVLTSEMKGKNKMKRRERMEHKSSHAEIRIQKGWRREGFREEQDGSESIHAKG